MQPLFLDRIQFLLASIPSLGILEQSAACAPNDSPGDQSVGPISKENIGIPIDRPKVLAQIAPKP